MGKINRNSEFRIHNTTTKRPPSSSKMIKSFYEQPKFDQAADLKIEDFLNDGLNSSSNLSESDQLSIITDALKDHTKIFYALKQRNENLEGLLKYW